MDSSPSKRRKIAQALGVSVDASNTEQLSATQEGRALTPGRASFMSPTKSSLARYNPSLLPRAKSAGVDVSGEPTDQTWTPRKLNAVPLRPTTPNERPARFSASPVRAGSASPRRKSAQSIGGRLSEPARRRSRTPARLSEPPTQLQKSPSSRGAGQAQQPDVADAVDSQLSQELQATTSGVASQNTEEPDLPPTPEQLGLKPMPQPPGGLMSSSPAVRASKRRWKTKQSSPLKSLRSPERVDKVDKTPTAEAVSAPQEQQDIELEVEVIEENAGEALQKKTLDSMKTQLANLQGDISKLESSVLQPQVTTEGGSSGVQDIVAIVTSTNPTCKPVPPPPKPLSLSAKLAFFLPFSRRPSRPKESPVEHEKLPSYHPIDVDDPIPQLRAFHPLSITSSAEIVGASLQYQVLLRQQDLHLTSPLSLLKIHLKLTINTSNDSVHELTLEELSPWAEQELGSWLRPLAKTGDISSMGWACGRYWEIAYKRARVWTYCCRVFPDLVPKGLKESGELLGEEQTGLRLNARGQQVDQSDDNQTPDKSFPSREQLGLHLGRDSLCFSRDGVSIVFRWRIGFDWTGEVQSRLNAEAAFPPSWHKADERQSLAKLSDLFRMLVGERGVFEAIRITAGTVWLDSQVATE